MSDRPYTEQQVFEVEVSADDIARILASAGPWALREVGEELLAAIVYDACIALREDMIDEENEARRSNG